MNLDQTVTGTLATPFAPDQWNFTAAKGQSVLFHLVKESSPGITFTLTGPSGYTAFTDITADSQVAIPVSGAYTLVAHNLTGVTGSYSFVLYDVTQTALTIGQSYSGTLAGTGQPQILTVSVPTSEILTISFKDTNTNDHDELYAQLGSPPTRETYGYSSASTGNNQSILIPSATVGTWYVLVYTENVPQPSSFTLLASLSEVALTSSSPIQSAANVTTNLTIQGAGFNSGSKVALVSSNGTSYTPTTSELDLSTKMTATIAPNTVPAGNYSLKVTQADGASAQLPNALNLVAVGQANLTAYLEIPNPMTRHIAETLYIDYKNIGNAPMPAPLLVLTATNPAGQQGALFTLNPALQGEGLWTNTTPVGYSQSVEVLASGATPGILEPGELERIPVYYAGWLTSQWDFTQTTLNFSLQTIQASDTRPMNWNGETYVKVTEDVPGLADSKTGRGGGGYIYTYYFVAPYINGQPQTESQITQEIYSSVSSSGESPLSISIGYFDNEPGIAESPPPTISTTAWNVITSNLEASIGNTMGDYVNALDNETSHLGQLGEDDTDVQSLWGFEVQQADASLNPLAPFLTSVTDDSVATPGNLSLSFGRSFTESISGRDTMGPLGMGWSDSWQTSAVVNADGSVTIIEPGGGQATFEPDVRTTGAYFSPLGDTSTLAADGNGGYLLTQADGIQTDYTSAGLLNYMQDTSGNTITAGYINGQLTSLTSSSGQYIKLAYNSAGLISSTTDSDGRTTTYQYDSTNTYLLSVTDPNGQVIGYTYNTTSGSAAQNALTTIAFPGGTHQYFTYDSEGRLASTAGDNNSSPESFTYNLGQVNVTNASGDTSEIFYNENDEIGRTVDALGNPTYYSYNGQFNLTGITNALGQSANYTYNSAGEVTSSTDFLGNATKYGYGGPFNELTSLTDANGNTTQYAYGSTVNLLSTTYPNGTSSSLTYNPLGEASSFVNQSGVPINYTYNSAGQLTQESFSDGSSYSYTYNSQENLASAMDSSGTITFTYDPVTQYLTEVAYPNGTFLKFSYNAAGQRTQMVDQTGNTTNYAYDSVGRLVQLTDGNSKVLVTYTYNANGQLSKTLNGNGTYTTYQYDDDGNVLDLINYASNGSINSSFAYKYNALGLETSETTIDGKWVYAYNADGWLTSAIFTPNNTDPDGLTVQNLTYNYDAAGNRTSTIVNGVTTAYAVNDMNQYTSFGSAAYTYDPEGNLLSDGVNTYSYNPLNELTGINGPSGLNAYMYNALGEQVASVTGGQTTQYLFDPLGLSSVVGAYAANGSTIANYNYGLGLVSQTTPSGTNYYQFDQLGSTANLTNSIGAVLNTYNYLPFGGIQSSTGSTANPFQFVGQFGVTAGNSVLDAMGARFYSPVSGVFTSTDPLQLMAPTFYSYARNNPVSLIDPSGFRAGSTPGAGSQGGLSWEVYSAQHLYDPALGFATGVSDTVSNNPDRNGQTQEDVLNSFGDWGVGAGVNWGNPTDTVTWNFGEFFYLDVNSGNGGLGFDLGIGVGLDMFSKFPFNITIPDPTIPPNPNSQNTKIYVPQAQDPNAMYGPAGFGASNFVAGRQTNYPFLITFENSPTATAPAQEVTITNQLDPNLDWSTFQLTGISWGSINVTIPAGSQHYQTTLPMTYNGTTFDVEVEVGIHTATGQVYATFQSIDPNTNLPPSNPLVGFLPPEEGTGRGEGSISYTISPKSNLPTGTQIRSVADVTFDQGLVIATDQVNDEDPSQGIDTTKQALVTIDSGAPTSSVAALPTDSPNGFTLNWSGQDDTGGSGIASYDLYVSVNGGPYSLILQNTTLTSAAFSGIPGDQYSFYSVATDNVGNTQPTPTAAQATTTLTAANAAPALSGFSGTDTYVKGLAPIQIAPNLVVTDLVGVASATVTITNWTSNEDRLYFYNSAALQNTFVINNTNTATLTLTGNATAAAYQTELRSITYRDVNDNVPVLTARDVSITVSDGTSNSNAATGNIVVQNVDLPPVLSAIETTSLVFAANHPEAPAVPISATLLVSDPDSAELREATVQITSGYQNTASDHDVLSFVNRYGITGSFDAATGILTLTGDSPVGYYREALRSVMFGTSGTAISTATRTLTITVFDTNSPTPVASTSITRNITVTTTNASPTLSGFSGTDTYVKGPTPITLAPNLIVADSDSSKLASATVTITNWSSNEDRLYFYNSAALQNSFVVNTTNDTATLTLTGFATPAQYQTELRSIMYRDVNDDVPILTARDVSITVNDGHSNSNTLTGSIVVQNVDLPPVLSGIETTPLVFAANHPESAAVAISATLKVYDPDSVDLSKATVQITSGYQNTSSDHDVLSFVNQHGITGSFNAGTGMLILTGNAAVIYYQEALRSVMIGTSGSAVSTATRTLTITVFDTHSPTPVASKSLTRNITVTTTNASPTLSGFSGTVTYVKGPTPIALAPNLVVADSDSLKLASATVTITNWSSNEDRLYFYNSAALQNTFVVNTTNNTATLTLTGFATPAQYQTELRSITYRDVNENVPILTARGVSITVNDGHSNSNTLTGNIVVGNVDLPPVLSGIETTPLAYTANGTPAAISSTVVISDPDSVNLSKLTVQITSGYQNNTSGHDVLSFVNKNGITGSFNATTGMLTLTGKASIANYQAALRSVTFQASGTTVSTATRTLTITAYDTNSPTPATSIAVIRNIAVTA